MDVDRWLMDPAELGAHPGAGSTDRDYSEAYCVVGTYEPGASATGTTPAEAPAGTAGTAPAGRSLILNGHIDVVPIGALEEWKHDPFDAYIEDGWMYGRGAGDMKAGMVALLHAYDAVFAAGLKPAGRIHIQSVPEEESTGNGALATILRGYLADAVLIGEPHFGKMNRAQIGLMWVKVRLTGKAAHASIMKEGFNAIDAAYAMISDFRKLEVEWNIRAKEHPLYAEQGHPINFNVGTIRGGDWPSSVLDWCEMVVRAAVPVGMPVEDAWQEIRARVELAVKENPGLEGATATVERVGYYANPYELPEGSPQEVLLKEVFRSVTGSEIVDKGATGYTDARKYGEYLGIPTFCFGALAEHAHAPGERVDVDSIRATTKVMALFIAEWCGVTEG